jgi:hypothetical protein
VLCQDTVHKTSQSIGGRLFANVVRYALLSLMQGGRMPLPSNNRHFEKGTLAGYKASHKDLVKAVSSFKKGTRTFGPVSFNGDNGQGFFAQLEDPEAPQLVNQDGERVVVGAAVSAGTIEIKHTGGAVTIGNDGVFLECADVTIPAGASLVFCYAFFNFDPNDNSNDFAVFHAYKNDDLTKAPTQFVLDYKKRVGLKQGTAKLTEIRKFEGWTEVAWTPGARFQGTMRWIVCNGQYLQTVNQATSALKNAWPSCLLLDAIDVRMI